MRRILGARYSITANGVEPFDERNLCFTAVQAGSTVAMTNSGCTNTIALQYTTSKTERWQNFIPGTTTVPLANVGDKVWIRAKTTNGAMSEVSNYRYFSLSGRVAASGNIMGLLDKTFATTTAPDYAFRRLFGWAGSLTTTPDLPATSIGQYAYAEMFRNCTSLTTHSQLMASTMGYAGCDQMFRDCTAITSVPDLKFTAVTDYGMRMMYRSCTHLLAAPEIPAASVGINCFDEMFHMCYAMVTPPTELPFTEAKNLCCMNMFRECHALTSMPKLRAETLAESCYNSMFVNCTSLTESTFLPATTMVSNCYAYLFYGCTSLGAIHTAQTSFTGCSYWLNNNGGTADGILDCPLALGTNDTISRGDSYCKTGWTVYNIADPVFWADAADPWFITKNASNEVTQWLGRDASHTPCVTVSGRSGTWHNPAWVDNSLNGLPIVDFGSAGSMTDLDITEKTGIGTVFFVYKIQQTMNAFWMGHHNDYTFHRGGNGQYGGWGYVQSSNVLCDDTVVSNPGSEFPPPDAYHVYTMYNSNCPFTFDRMTWDRDQGSSRSGGSQRAEIIAFNRVLTANEMQRVRDLLYAKWGITPSS